jgi:hypothetical protein
MAEARAVACQNALEAIQTAGEKDWRAHTEWLKMCHPEYRQAGTKIDISATATGQQANIVCTPEQREALIKQRERLLAGVNTPLEAPQMPSSETKPSNDTQASAGAPKAEDGSPLTLMESLNESPIWQELGPDEMEP